jgi:hypothetical protein
VAHVQMRKQLLGGAGVLRWQPVALELNRGKFDVAIRHAQRIVKKYLHLGLEWECAVAYAVCNDVEIRYDSCFGGIPFRLCKFHPV